MNIQHLKLNQTEIDKNLTAITYCRLRKAKKEVKLHFFVNYILPYQSTLPYKLLFILDLPHSL